MSLRSPLGKVRGLGSAKNGTHHWWMQKITAVALIPMTIWFVSSIVHMTQADYEIVINWMNSPVVAILMMLFVATSIYHLKLGLQVIIEDYIHEEGSKIALQMIVTFGCVVLATTALFSILKIAL
jgi:succinate dehydrogenase / fumarate reductase, membrane anchor subunit